MFNQLPPLNQGEIKGSYQVPSSITSLPLTEIILIQEVENCQICLMLFSEAKKANAKLVNISTFIAFFARYSGSPELETYKDSIFICFGKENGRTMSNSYPGGGSFKELCFFVASYGHHGPTDSMYSHGFKFIPNSWLFKSDSVFCLDKDPYVLVCV